nr:hypothetical protein Iba_chr11bCG9310 [Ipomoea batatas]
MRLELCNRINGGENSSQSRNRGLVTKTRLIEGSTADIEVVSGRRGGGIRRNLAGCVVAVAQSGGSRCSGRGGGSGRPKSRVAKLIVHGGENLIRGFDCFFQVLLSLDCQFLYGLCLFLHVPGEQWWRNCDCFV